MSRDDDQLKLLAILHYILGGLTALFALIPIIYVIIGIAIISGSLPKPANGEELPQAAGWIFIALGAIFFLLGEAYAIGLILAGRNLRRRRRYVYCMVVAALSCLNMPLGSALGIFTIVVLQRPSVKELFERAKYRAPVSEFD